MNSPFGISPSFDPLPCAGHGCMKPCPSGCQISLESWVRTFRITKSSFSFTSGTKRSGGMTRSRLARFSSDAGASAFGCFSSACFPFASDSSSMCARIDSNDDLTFAASHLLDVVWSSKVPKNSFHVFAKPPSLPHQNLTKEEVYNVRDCSGGSKDQIIVGCRPIEPP